MEEEKPIIPPPSLTPKKDFTNAGYLLVVPTILVWITGFLSQGAHIDFFTSALNAFHSWPKFIDLTIELLLPLIAYILAFNSPKKIRRMILLFISGLLVVFALLGLMFAKQI